MRAALIPSKAVLDWSTVTVGNVNSVLFFLPNNTFMCCSMGLGIKSPRIFSTIKVGNEGGYVEGDVVAAVLHLVVQSHRIGLWPGFVHHFQGFI